EPPLAHLDAAGCPLLGADRRRRCRAVGAGARPSRQADHDRRARGAPARAAGQVDVDHARRFLARPHRGGAETPRQAAADRGRGGGRRADADARRRRADRGARNVTGNVMRTILVTGFGPFPRAPFNPTAALAARPAAGGRGRGIRCVAHVFETSYAAVDRDLPALLAAHRPDVVVMFGLAGRRTKVSIETFARNRSRVWFPDATGVMPARSAIALGAPASRRGRAPFTRMLAAARATRVPTTLSSDAGSDLCNYVSWRR